MPLPGPVLRLAAFARDGQGGNPAGVVVGDTMPAAADMQAVARAVGYSETAFLAPQDDGWRVRYFAPALEVPFCGHATIALGAVLGERFGPGDYPLILNDGRISVRAERTATGFQATLRSPPTWSSDAPPALTEQVLAHFELTPGQLDPAVPVRLAGAGARHLILFVRDRRTLAEMRYPFEPVRALMVASNLVTLCLAWRESDAQFHCRNPFAAGGVYEDPATGAAAAALAGYLRDLRRDGPRSFTILQGEDMGIPSRVLVSYGPTAGEGVAVGGEVRHLDPPPVHPGTG